MPTFESFDGLSLFYDDQGDGEPVVLLHGFAADTNINWVRSGIFDALLDEGYRVIPLDARGHGLSGKPREPEAYEGDAMTRDVQALLDHLVCDRCSVLGYSMGASTALRLAVVEPRVTAAAVLGVGGATLDGDGSDRWQLAEALLADDTASIDHPIAAEFRRLADSVRADRQALAAYARSVRPSLGDHLHRIAVPVLVVAGGDDELAGRPDDLAARIPGARAVTVPGDHFTATARPQLHQAVLEFLGR